CPQQPLLKLTATIAAIDQMGMAVDQAGCQQATPAINYFTLEAGKVELSFRQYQADQPRPDSEDLILQHAVRLRDRRVESCNTYITPKLFALRCCKEHGPVDASLNLCSCNSIMEFYDNLSTRRSS